VSMDKASNSTEKLKSFFREMVVYKSPTRSKEFSSLSIPSYLRDWLVMRFSDSDGNLDMDEVHDYAKRRIPARDEWEGLKGRMRFGGESVRFLAKLRVEIDVRTGEGLFTLPDFGFPSRKYEAVIDRSVVKKKQEELLQASETWGVIELEWRMEEMVGRPEEGRIVLMDFSPFQPYKVDLDYYQIARSKFSLEEWIDQLLMAVDYSPEGFLTQREKLSLLARLLPFVEKRLNTIELAPKGTGKSYMLSQLSKHGWLVSGGSISRARLFYDLARRTPGLVSRYDYVALDEIQSVTFADEEEVRGALKGYMENPSGEYRIGDYRGIGNAGIVLLGNIDVDSMNERTNMFSELPTAFQESALIDRFHGFVRGWYIPRMKENLKAKGWGLNTEYFSEILHDLRDDIRYRAYVDNALVVPRGADTRDTEAIKRLSTAWLKLLFPHAVCDDAMDAADFRQYCLDPAIDMRRVIRRQLHIMDSEYTDSLPEISCRE